MKMEDLLGGMMKDINFTGSINPSTLIAEMMRKVEYDILLQMKAQIDAQIRIMAAKKTGTQEQQPKNENTNDEMDPYRILGVDKNSTYEEVKSAYKKKSKECHPDKGGNWRDMAKVNAAWEVLMRINHWEKYKDK